MTRREKDFEIQASNPVREVSYSTGSQEQGSSPSTNTTSTTTTRTHASGRIHKFESTATLDSIGITYSENIGPIDPAAARILLHYAQVMSLDCIEHAILETGDAPRPSKQYLKAILRRYYMSGIKTWEDVLKDEDEHQRLIESNNRRRSAKWYDDPSMMTEDDWRRDMPF